MTDDSGYQEYAEGGLSARGMAKREAHIREIEAQARVIRARNAQIAELVAKVKEATASSARGKGHFAVTVGSISDNKVKKEILVEALDPDGALWKALQSLPKGDWWPEQVVEQL